MIRRSSLDEIVWWIPCLCFFGPAYKAGQDQLGSRDRLGMNSHWLLRRLGMLLWHLLHPPGSEVNSRRILIGPWKMLLARCLLSPPGPYLPGYPG